MTVDFDPWASPDLVQATLADGTRVVVLPVGPQEGDHQLLRAQLLAHFPELSADSRYTRFLGPVPQLTSSMLCRLVDTVDNVDHVALNAQVLDAEVSGAQMHGALVGTPIGLARFIRDPHLPTVAESAVTVLDEWQHLGVGALLMRSLAQAALRRGITTFAANIMSTNVAALALLEHAGGVTRSPIGQGVIHVAAALTPLR